MQKDKFKKKIHLYFGKNGCKNSVKQLNHERLEVRLNSLGDEKYTVQGNLYYLDDTNIFAICFHRMGIKIKCSSTQFYF